VKPKVLMILLLCLLMVVSVAVAANGEDLRRQLISAGGGTSQNGAYAVQASIGQAVAGYTEDSTIELHAGFWNGSVPKYEVFLSAVRNSFP
jgi:transcription elongation GreA/GreB family factor